MEFTFAQPTDACQEGNGSARRIKAPAFQDYEIDQFDDAEWDSMAVTCDSHIEWALGQIRSSRAWRDQMIDHHAHEIEKQKRQHDAYETRMLAYIEPYFDSLPKKPTKTQEAFKFSNGKLVRRFAKQVIDVQDPGAAIEWVENNGEADQYIRVKKEIRLADFKKRLQIHGGCVVDSDTGEIVPGVVVAEKPSQFVVEGL